MFFCSIFAHNFLLKDTFCTPLSLICRKRPETFTLWHRRQACKWLLRTPARPPRCVILFTHKYYLGKSRILSVHQLLPTSAPNNTWHSDHACSCYSLWEGKYKVDRWGNVPTNLREKWQVQKLESKHIHVCVCVCVFCVCVCVCVYQGVYHY